MSASVSAGRIRDLHLMARLHPFSGWSKCKAELDKLARIAAWTLHDLRRTFRTTLGRLKVRPDIAERLVNHISARTEMEETYDLTGRLAAPQRIPAWCHVWTAPDWQGLSSRSKLGRCSHVFGLLMRFT
jgi:integrase